MKKVLIIGYLWPYLTGSVRVIHLAKSLPEFGWEPVILTAPLREKPDTQFQVIETPYRDALGFWKKLFGFGKDKDIKRQVKERFGITSRNSLMDFILTCGGAIINYPDPYKGWRPFAIKAGSELLQEENIDAMISIWPVTSHLVANELKSRYKIPWVADFPDLWSRNHNYSYGPLRKLIDRRLELKTLSTADALVTVSQHWAEKLRILHKGKSVYAITHGFDPAEVNNPPVELAAKFTITYTGSIWARKQHPWKLFAALRGLISDGTINPNEIEVRFYGPEEGWLEKEIEQYGLSNIVKQHGVIPRQVALEKQRESQLLLLIAWEDRQKQGAYGAKTPEYLAARRPILTTGDSSDIIKELLNETNAGIRAITVADIKSSLKELYQEYELKGEVAYKGDELKINQYSHLEMAKKFSDILDHLQHR